MLSPCLSHVYRMIISGLPQAYLRHAHVSGHVANASRHDQEPELRAPHWGLAKSLRPCPWVGVRIYQSLLQQIRSVHGPRNSGTMGGVRVRVPVQETNQHQDTFNLADPDVAKNRLGDAGTPAHNPVPGK